MTLCDTWFWVDRSPRSIGIRSSNRKTGSQPFEFYAEKPFRWLPDFNFYETDHEHGNIEIRLSARCFWFSLNALIWNTRKMLPKPTWDWNGRKWGWYFIDQSIVVGFGKTLTWDLPFWSLVFVRHEFLSLDRKRVVYVEPHRGGFEQPEYGRREEAKAANSATYPYRYELLKGETQDVFATVNVERWIHRYKWTPFKRVSESINVTFNEEVGPARGSWKGGCTGCGYTLKRGENAIQCLRRMERDRRFER